MNKPTKELECEMSGFPANTIGDSLWFLDKLQERGYSPGRIAFIRALISASPEAGEPRVPSVAGELIDREYSEDDGGPTDLTPSDSEMQKHYDRGEMASSAPLPVEVEAAMKRIGTAMDDAYYGREEYAGVHEAGDKKIDDWAALATIRAALTEARQPKVVSRKEVREWAKVMSTCADHYGKLTTEEFVAVTEANENYLRDKLETKGLAVEEPK